MKVPRYPCVGGPLAGEYANSTDFFGRSRFLGKPNPDLPHDGKYVDYADQYTLYRGPTDRGAVLDGEFPPRYVYLHQSVLKPVSTS